MPVTTPRALAALFALTWAVPAASADGPAPPSPVPAHQAAARMTLPEGFRVTLYAAEPDVVQPIALTFDPKGRLWVVECMSYPQWEMTAGKAGRDRVVVFEDSDGDGRFDRRKVFWDQGTNLSGIEVGFGGVWLCSTPNLVFVPDADGDDRPDGPPQVVLDGWDLRAQHNVFNGLTWGPDGWLWGCNGILSNSLVGPPGTPPAQRTRLNCGIWRYHPVRKTFEVVASGTTNPWGLDFDASGEAFLTNCVIPHLFHVVPGAHFERMFGEDLTPNVYGLIPTCADHVHWDRSAERWLDIRARGVTPTTDKLGGGHAHSGAAVYLGDTWPASYRNTVLMGNIHGNRLNRDRLEPAGSGYVARHEADFLKANDRWFRTVAQKLGPDGSLYVLDWSDTGECHEQDADGAHRENGRIYKVTYGPPVPPRGDLAALDDRALAALHSDRNEWRVRQARRLLQERAAAGRDLAAAHAPLREALNGRGDDAARLRALWALNASGGIDAAGLAALRADRSPDVRAWAVRLLVDDRARPVAADHLAALEGLARTEPSARVRLALASALQRVPLDRRRGLAEAVLGRAEDAADPVLPLMAWYGVEPIASADQGVGASWAVSSKLPVTRRFLARRVIEADPNGGPSRLVASLAAAGDGLTADAAGDVLDGLVDGLRGRRNVPMPAAWPSLADRLARLSPVRLAWPVEKLGLVFGDARMAARLRDRVGDRDVPARDRVAALEALAAARVPGLVPELLDCLKEPALRVPALRALAAYDDPAVPTAVLGGYTRFEPTDRAAAVETLAERPAWALAMLEAVGKGTVARRDVPVTVARQIQAYRRPELDAALARHWGDLRPASADKAARMAHFKELLSPAALAAADPGRGRLVFERNCQNCHKLYGNGGDVGPELTGSDRANLEYVLQNVLDPSASVANEYRVTNVATADGRLVAGLVRERTPSALVVRTAEGVVVIPRSEVEEERPSAVSMMPEGLFDRLTEPEVRDLVSYLATRAQVPAAAAP